MFTLNDVTLRPLVFSDMDSLYTWMADIELCLWGGWTPVLEGPLSRDAFRPLFEQHFAQAKDDQVMLGIEVENRLVGFVQLANIDQRMRRAGIGIAIGDKSLRGQGIGTTALRLLLDYAFTVKNLERIYAEVFSYNLRSQKLMKRVGFQREGLLRQHDIRNGVRQDTISILECSSRSFINGMRRSSNCPRLQHTAILRMMEQERNSLLDETCQGHRCRLRTALLIQWPPKYVPAKLQPQLVSRTLGYFVAPGGA